MSTQCEIMTCWVHKGYFDWNQSAASPYHYQFLHGIHILGSFGVAPLCVCVWYQELFIESWAIFYQYKINILLLMFRCICSTSFFAVNCGCIYALCERELLFFILEKQIKSIVMFIISWYRN